TAEPAAPVWRAPMTMDSNIDPTADAHGARGDGCKSVRLEQPTGNLVIDVYPTRLCAVFKVTEPQLAARLLSQLVSVLQPDHAKAADLEAINCALAVIEALEPRDAVEAMTAIMIVAAHH